MVAHTYPQADPHAEPDPDRLPPEKILDYHGACLLWARWGRMIRTSIPKHAKNRRAAIARKMGVNADVFELAERCVAGRGHH